ncbi:MAG TPA: acyltransferase [Xanthobacteraceae bacterium]|jgi:peptidoglycan/LPS O-acetylase OafA/YrhL|nr:acyltransferase [Xanthobacteraceae bacterium]
MQKIGGIQVTRAVAANMVMVSHLAVVETKYSAGFAIIPQNEQIGQLGVHIFFVVSGIVMALLAERRPDWQRFAWDRITRIYPIYWLYTALALFVAFVAPHAINSSFSETPSILKSVLLWPDRSLPWLAVGWSLIHEMYFYAVMTAIIAFRLNLVASLIVWAGVIAAPIPHSGPELSVILSPMTFEFIGGAFIGIFISRYPRNWPSIPALERIGDASYSIYLSHVFVISAIGRIYALIPYHSYMSEAVFILIAIVAANLYGLLSYRYIEQPAILAARRLADYRLMGQERKPS